MSIINKIDCINNINEFGNVFTDPETGLTYGINDSTGEIIELVPVLVEPGSKISSPAKQAAIEKWKKNQEEKELKRRARRSTGRQFVFILSDETFDDLTPETVVRLIYLSTYIKICSDNRLMLTERTPMKRKDLAKVLGVSKATSSRFWKEVCPAYISEGDDGLMLVNEDIFVRGKLNQNDHAAPHLRFWIDGVRLLYKSVPKNIHKQLGYVFKLLPYINYTYNILCYNPSETDLDAVERITISDFCKITRYDISHITKLLKIYDSILIEVNGKPEHFISLVNDGTNKKDTRIFINPHVLYSGTAYDHVKELGSFCID